jgi:hypothetical protein
MLPESVSVEVEVVHLNQNRFLAAEQEKFDDVLMKQIVSGAKLLSI